MEIGLLILAYLVPTIIAMARRAENLGTILLLNMFLGWTFITWAVCLVWACADKKEVSKNA